ncbi:hypothetical protein [Longirhabdus pacifica]|uniref:hypothetical protein n=1 Tax=Longirhabdus pacifica TaxID=2305227 RepID=UPI001F0BC293|nr:hypothetical protein [Longirhabdus pacifica]
MSEDHKERMNPISNETVEVDGIYRNEWGYETVLKRGETFPSDPQLGTATWELVEFANESLKNDHNKNSPTRLHRDRGDK